MSTPVFQSPGFSTCSSRHGIRRHCQSRRPSVSLTTNFDPSSSTHRKHEEPILKLQPWKTHDQFRIVMKADSGFNQPQSSEDDDSNEMSRMEFLHSEDECHGLKDKMEFTVREAFRVEEFWSAAWLRAESFLEDRTDRFVASHKKKFLEREFYAIKRRFNPLNSPKCFCIIAVKKEEKNVKLTTLESIVGTLDFSVRQLLQGQTFPGEPLKPFSTFFSFNKPSPERYGCVTNVCVAKSARRQGIATKLLHFGIETAKSQGLEKVYVHVERVNKPAWELYRRMGFQIVESAANDSEEDQLLVLFTG